MNDYFRLVERRDMPRYRITYFNEENGKVAGYMISAADPGSMGTPLVSRYDEFEAWALANAPQEWEYLRPGGRLDPTDRAPKPLQTDAASSAAETRTTSQAGPG